MMTSKPMVKTLPITRMDCPTCIPLLEREVKQLEGVEEARGNYMTKTLKVTYHPDRVQLADIEATIERIGYQLAYKKYPSVLSKLKSLLIGEEANGVTSLTDDEFPEKVLHASLPVAVLFASPTCPTCHLFKKQFKEIAAESEGKAALYEMDIAATETWRKYDVLSIPTVLIFRNGQLSERFQALPKVDDIIRALAR
jgi:cation transport ATPase